MENINSNKKDIFIPSNVFAANITPQNNTFTGEINATNHTNNISNHSMVAAAELKALTQTQPNSQSTAQLSQASAKPIATNQPSLEPDAKAAQTTSQTNEQTNATCATLPSKSPTNRTPQAEQAAQATQEMSQITDYSKKSNTVFNNLIKLASTNSSLFVQALFELFDVRTKSALSEQLGTTVQTLIRWEKNANIRSATLDKFSLRIKAAIAKRKAQIAQQESTTLAQPTLPSTPAPEPTETAPSATATPACAEHTPRSFEPLAQPDSCAAQIRTLGDSAPVWLDKQILQLNSLDSTSLFAIVFRENSELFSVGEMAICKELKSLHGDGLYVFKIDGGYIIRKLYFSCTAGRYMAVVGSKEESLDSGILEALVGKILFKFQRI